MANRGDTIYEIVQHLEDAWNNGDSRHFASFFAQDADFINILGMHYSGRDVIDTGHRQIFDTIYRDSRNRYTIESVRSIRPDVVIAFLSAVLELRNGKVIRSRPTIVATKESGRWQIVVLQNTMVSDVRP